MLFRESEERIFPFSSCRRRDISHNLLRIAPWLVLLMFRRELSLRHFSIVNWFLHNSLQCAVALRTVLSPCIGNQSAVINHYFSSTRTVISNKYCRHSSCITFTVFIHQLEQCTQQKLYGALNKAPHNSTFSYFFLCPGNLAPN